MVRDSGDRLGLVAGFDGIKDCLVNLDDISLTFSAPGKLSAQVVIHVPEYSKKLTHELVVQRCKDLFMKRSVGVVARRALSSIFFQLVKLVLELVQLIIIDDVDDLRDKASFERLPQVDDFVQVVPV